MRHWNDFEECVLFRLMFRGISMEEAILNWWDFLEKNVLELT